MPFNDFRTFLTALRDKCELIDVNREVSLNLEVGKALRKSAAISGPAIIFTKNGTPYSLVGGVYNSRAKALIAFEATEDNILEKILIGLNHPIPSKIVDSGPAQENVILEADVDLSKLPIPKYSPADGGSYLTAGIVVSTDPDTGITDIGNYRFELIDNKTLSFLAQPNHRFGKNLAKARKKGFKTFHAAIILGVDPMIAYTCQFQLTDQTSDFDIAGGLRGAPVELVKCKAINEKVPSTAEFVIELEIDLTQNVFEGPLGEYTGYYTPGSEKPIARVKAITHRNSPYFQALLTGVPTTENHILKQLPFEASFFNEMKKSFPTLKKVAIPPSGGVSFYIVMGMEPRFDGEARQAILAAMSSNLRPKMVIVVNSDVDVQNPNEVEWALSFRMQPHEDVIVMDNLPAGPLDPCILDSVPLDARLASSIGIDATYPFASIVAEAGENPPEEAGKLYFKVAEIPGWQDYVFPELDKGTKK